MTADKIDRCGIWPVIIAHDEFKSMCEWHDQMYEYKEAGQQPMSRKEVDARFLKAMLIQAKARDSWTGKYRAYIYYGIARLLGGPFWKWL